MAHALRIGCSGWDYDAWRERFYPSGTPKRAWLSHYASQFDTVELNSTFYRLARPAAAQRWVDDTPDGFLFAAKASRYLTHMRRLTDLDRGIERFYAGIEPLVAARRLGPVIWQLPATFTRDDERLAAALDAIAQRPPGRHAFEFRDPSWFVPEVEELLRDHGVALVIGDRPERPFQTFARTAPFTVVRFHYGHRGRHGNYSETELETWARRLRQWLRETDVYAYFNNDWEGFAPHNARRLRELLGA